MWRFVLFLLLLAPAAAMGQTLTPVMPGTTAAVDETARSAAQAASALAASKCDPMAVVPPVEVPGGTTGTGTGCRLATAADNRISRTAVFSYNAAGAVLCGGSSTCSWSTPLPAGAFSYPVFYTAIGASSSPSVKCKVASSTNTGFTGMTCAQSNVSIALAGSADITVGLTPGQVFVLSLPSTQASQ